MTGSPATRRRVVATTVGAGGVGVLGGGAYGLIRTQAMMARRRIQAGDRSTPPDPSGLYGALQPGRPIRLALVGDSAAAGFGATTSSETYGAYLATGLARLAGRPVHLTCVPVVGARSSDLGRQVDAIVPRRPDAAVIVVGGNDVTHAVLPKTAAGHLAANVERLRQHGIAVVVGTCPDLGTVRPIMPPARQLCRVWSRRMAAAQTVAVVRSGGITVSLGSLLGPEFDASPALMFGPDQFHPSPHGYRAVAAAMLPSLAASLGVLPPEDRAVVPERGDGIRDLEQAAEAAAGSPGTEVGVVEGHGVPRRFGFLRRRRRHRLPATADEPAAG